MGELIFEKIQIPKPKVNMIIRDRILKTFRDLNEKKLLYVHAPAGYGKTVIISQFLESIDYPVAWYQLDPFDNDLMVFIQYLTGAIAKAVR